MKCNLYEATQVAYVRKKYLIEIEIIIVFWVINIACLVPLEYISSPFFWPQFFSKSIPYFLCFFWGVLDFSTFSHLKQLPDNFSVPFLIGVGINWQIEILWNCIAHSNTYIMQHHAGESYCSHLLTAAFAFPKQYSPSSF